MKRTACFKILIPIFLLPFRKLNEDMSGATHTKHIKSERVYLPTTKMFLVKSHASFLPLHNARCETNVQPMGTFFFVALLCLPFKHE